LAMDNRCYKTIQNPKGQKRKRVDERRDSRQADEKICSLVFLTDWLITALELDIS